MKKIYILLLCFSVLKGAVAPAVDFKDVLVENNFVALQALSRRITAEDSGTHTAQIVKEIGDAKACDHEQELDKYLFLVSLGICHSNHGFDRFISKCDGCFRGDNSVDPDVFFAAAFSVLKEVMNKHLIDISFVVAQFSYDLEGAKALLRDTLEEQRLPFLSIYYIPSRLLKSPFADEVVALDKAASLLTLSDQSPCIAALGNRESFVQEQRKPSPYVALASIFSGGPLQYWSTSLEIQRKPEGCMVVYRDKMEKDGIPCQLIVGAQFKMAHVPQSSPERGLNGQCRGHANALWHELESDFNGDNALVRPCLRDFYKLMCQKRHCLTAIEEVFGIIWAYGVKDGSAGSCDYVDRDEFCLGLQRFFAQGDLARRVADHADMKQLLRVSGTQHRLMDPMMRPSDYVLTHQGSAVRNLLQKVYFQ